MADLSTLLSRTSRTFALAIPELGEPTRREVEVAYLLFRIADTFEDATRWSAAQQVRALATVERLLDGGSPDAAGAHARRWRREPPVDHAGCVALLGETPAVLATLSELRPAARTTIRYHVGRTARGMARYVERPRGLRLETLRDLRDYCYVVAGLVGEMLTELFLLERPELDGVASALRAHARWFGEGLQLTNVLKDAAGDAQEGRFLLPDPGKREAVFTLAREDLRLAEEYVGLLEEADAPGGLVAFSALPVLLAWATLDRVEAEGPGAKLTRGEVAGTVANLRRALEAGRPALTALDGRPARL